MFSTIFTAWLSIIVLMIIVWLIFLWQKNPCIIDVFWAISISAAALPFSHIDSNNLTKLSLQILLVIWAVRLSGYLLLKRILPQHIDKRYESLSKNWTTSKNIGFLLNFQLQGFLALIIATPFIFISGITSLHGLTLASMTLIIVGIAGESIADFQLQQFKKKTTKAVCNVGLWKYSRHPNYFFELLIWFGFSLAGCSMHLGWLGLISPLLLLILMTKITVPITEKSSIASRGKNYLDYQKRTSAIIPWPPKKEN